MPQPKYFQNLDTQILNANAIDIGGSLSLKGITVVSPASGSNVKISVAAPGVIVAPSGGLSDVALQFPSNPSDGQVIFVSFTQDAAKVTFTNGKFANASVLGPVVSAGDSILIFYNGETGKWYKLSGSAKPSTATGTVTPPAPAPPAPVPAPPAPVPDTPANELPVSTATDLVPLV